MPTPGTWEKALLDADMFCLQWLALLYPIPCLCALSSVTSWRK